MELVPREVERYVAIHTSPGSSLLSELERETFERTDFPQMLSGAVEGRFLQILIKISGARRILEIGTYTGLSTLMMAEGLPDNGELITLEINKEYAEIAKKYFRRSLHSHKIKLILGPAINTIRRLPDDSFDFIFIDADKQSYPSYYSESIRLLRSGGLAVADNALWSGKVLAPKDLESRAIMEFNEAVRRDNRVEKVLLTIRDGVFLIRKI